MKSYEKELEIKEIDTNKNLKVLKAPSPNFKKSTKKKCIAFKKCIEISTKNSAARWRHFQRAMK